MMQTTESVGVAADIATGLLDSVRALKRTSMVAGSDPAMLVMLWSLECVGSCRQSELAEHVHLDMSTVSRHVRALEERGLVARQSDPEDRRAHVIGLTPEGEAYLRRGLAARAATIDLAVADWSETDRELLATLLGRLASELATSAPAHHHVKENS